jgi:hypothetical protein
VKGKEGVLLWDDAEAESLAETRRDMLACQSFRVVNTPHLSKM